MKSVMKDHIPSILILQFPSLELLKTSPDYGSDSDSHADYDAHGDDDDAPPHFHQDILAAAGDILAAPATFLLYAFCAGARACSR